MKNQITILIFSAAMLMAVLYGCNTVNTTEQEFSDEELEMAGEIIAESLSDERGGFISSLYDAFSEVDEEGITYQRSLADGELFSSSINTIINVNRTDESEYSADYDPETGEHIIAFRRYFQGPLLTKSISVLNKYIFIDVNSEFLQFPRRQQNLIETIDFKGMRSGMAQTERRSSSFTRTDTLFTTGISSESEILSLEGSHDGDGEMTANLRRATGTTERSYRVRFDFQNIQVDKAVVRESGSLENGITGIVTYRLKMSRTTDGQTREKTLSGIIELTGDGQALLRFDRIRDTFTIALRNGTLNL
jgi:hypothetical protein